MIPVKPNSERHYADLIQSQWSGFWYHRYSKPPEYAVEKIAADKGYLPVFNVFNPQDAAQVKERLPRALKWADKNGPIALKMNFWPLTAKAQDLWDLAAWKRNLDNRFRVGGKVVMVFLDCEPPQAVHEAMKKTPATPEQAKAALDWIAGQERFDAAMPELRVPGDPAGTVSNQLYTLLQRLGWIRVNEWTYDPRRDFSWVPPTDIIGTRVSVAGDAGTYSPSQATASWPGRMRFIFPVGRTGREESDEMEIVTGL